MRDLRAKIGHDVILQPGVAAIIFNAAGQVLLQRRSDNGEWGLPGGIMEPGEEPAETLVREIREETALEVVPERIVGVYSGPEFVVRYPNGDEAAILSITFACRPVAGEPRVNDDESLEIRLFRARRPARDAAASPDADRGLRSGTTPAPASGRLPKGPDLFVGALGRTLNVEEVRLACDLRAPPRIWTLLGSLHVER